GNLVLVIQFAPGTLNRQTTRTTVLLDTDQVVSTGIAQNNSLGADYDLDLSAALSQATVNKANPAACAAMQGGFDAIGSLPVTLGTDSMQVTVPLSMLGGDDGRMSFLASTYVLVAPLTPVVFDFAPNLNLPPARIQ